MYRTADLSDGKYFQAKLIIWTIIKIIFTFAYRKESNIYFIHARKLNNFLRLIHQNRMHNHYNSNNFWYTVFHLCIWFYSQDMCNLQKLIQGQDIFFSFQLFVCNFQKKSTTLETHFGFTNCGSNMHISRLSAIWNYNFLFVSLCKKHKEGKNCWLILYDLYNEIGKTYTVYFWSLWVKIGQNIRFSHKYYLF